MTNQSLRDRFKLPETKTATVSQIISASVEVGKPYQKGAVEHINKLIRQYIPKGVSLKGYTQAMLNKIADELNDRVRKRLGWKSPKQLLFEVTTAPPI